MYYFEALFEGIFDEICTAPRFRGFPFPESVKNPKEIADSRRPDGPPVPDVPLSRANLVARWSKRKIVARKAVDAVFLCDRSLTAGNLSPAWLQSWPALAQWKRGFSMKECLGIENKGIRRPLPA